MDQYDRGVDPEIKKYFRQIVNSVSVGSFWLLILMLFGLYFRFGIVENGLSVGNIVFYIFFLVSLVAYIYFLYKVWRKSV